VSLGSPKWTFSGD